VTEFELLVKHLGYRVINLKEPLLYIKSFREFGILNNAVYVQNNACNIR